MRIYIYIYICASLNGIITIAIIVVMSIVLVTVM